MLESQRVSAPINKTSLVGTYPLCIPDCEVIDILECGSCPIFKYKIASQMVLYVRDPEVLRENVRKILYLWGAK